VAAADTAHFRPSPGSSVNFLTPTAHGVLSAFPSELSWFKAGIFSAALAALILHSREGFPSLAPLLVFGVLVGLTAHLPGRVARIPSVDPPSALSPALSANCQGDQ
jgi:hypothetical protein